MMIAILHLLVIFGVFGGLCFYRIPPYGWVPAAILTLFLSSALSSVPWWLLLPLWIGVIALSVLTLNVDLRKNLVTLPVLKFLKKAMPPISETEQIALDAGEVLWEGEIFKGNPNWSKLLDMGKPELTPDEQHFLDHEVETLCDMLNDWEIVNELGDLPPEVWAYIKENKFWGIEIPKEYGGLGFSALMHSSVITKICSRSVSTAVTVMVPNSLGPAELLRHYGTDEQKNYYLPRLAKGEDIPCFALTSPSAGSDATSITDSGIVCHGMHEGKSVIGLRLTWDKRYITLAPVATVLGLAVKVRDPDHLLGKHENIGITLCLIPTNHKGVEIGTRHCPLFAAFMNGPTRGEDVFIPLDWIIGGKERLGQGWQMLMECLSVGRAISLPSLASATGSLTFRTTGAYARIREQFNLPIGQFEGIADSLGRIGGIAYLLQANRLLAAQFVSAGSKPAVISAMAKYHMTELGRMIVNDAMDIHGGKGIQLGPRNYLGFGYVANPISITVEGANILTRNLMIFGQGALRCHPYLQEEIACANRSDNEAIMRFDSLLLSHMAFTARNAAASIAYGLTGGYFIASPRDGAVAQYYRQLTRMSASLAFISDISMLYLGGELKRRESVSARLGDVFSHIYMGTAILKYYEDNGANVDDLPYVHYAMQHCLYRIQIAFDEFFANISPVLGKVLRWTVFPWGRSYSAPKDKYAHLIAEHMMKATPFRERLTNLTYVGKTTDDPIFKLEDAWNQVLAVLPLQAKIRQAVKKGDISKLLPQEERIKAAVKLGILTELEGKSLATCTEAVADAVAVDEFPFDYLQKKSVKDWKEQRSA